MEVCQVTYKQIFTTIHRYLGNGELEGFPTLRGDGGGGGEGLNNGENEHENSFF